MFVSRVLNDDKKIVWLSDNMDVISGGHKTSFSTKTIAQISEGNYQILGFQEIAYKKTGVRKEHVIVRDLAHSGDEWCSTTSAGWVLRATMRGATEAELNEIKKPDGKRLHSLNLPTTERKVNIQHHQLREHGKPKPASESVEVSAAAKPPKRKRRKRSIQADKSDHQAAEHPDDTRHVHLSPEILEAIRNAISATHPAAQPSNPSNTDCSQITPAMQDHSQGVTFNFNFRM